MFSNFFAISYFNCIKFLLSQEINFTFICIKYQLAYIYIHDEWNKILLQTHELAFITFQIWLDYSTRKSSLKNRDKIISMENIFHKYLRNNLPSYLNQM